MMKNIEMRLQKVLTEYGIDRKRLSKDSDYYFDLNMNMFDLIGLTKHIYREFSVSIPEKEVFTMEKVSDTISLLEKRLPNEC